MAEKFGHRAEFREIIGYMRRRFVFCRNGVRSIRAWISCLGGAVFAREWALGFVPCSAEDPELTLECSVLHARSGEATRSTDFGAALKVPPFARTLSYQLSRSAGGCIGGQRVFFLKRPLVLRWNFRVLRIG